MKAVNLVPSEQRAGGANLAGSSEGGAFIVLGVMAALAVLAVLYGVAHHQISSRSGQAATLSAEASQAQAEASRLAPYTSFIAMRNQRRQAVAQLVGSRFDWAHAFHELGRVLPFDVSLTSVHGTVATEPAGASTATTTTTTTSTSTSAATSAAGTATPAAASAGVTSATPPGATPSFTVVGCATSQSEVAETLNRLRLMDGVTTVDLQSSTKSTSGSPAGSSGAGTCPGSDPSFTVKINFTPLPTPPAAGTPAPGSSASTVTAANTVTSTTTTTSASSTTTAATGGS